MRKIPATIITGFLGSGKTTAIRHLLENAGGTRIALIINEFGDLGMDKDFLVGCGIEGCNEEEVVELANGCICCTVADDFLPAMEAILARDPLPEHIVIETSGLALPKPLVQAFNWPAVRTRVTVDGVITVVDGLAVAHGHYAHDPVAVQKAREADEALDHDTPLEEVFIDQLLCADMILLNKRDLLDHGECARAKDGITKHTRSGVRIIETSHGKASPAVLLGMGAAVESVIEGRKSHHDGEDDHDHDDFDTIIVTPAHSMNMAELTEKITEAATVHTVLRVKGILNDPAKPMRQVVQAVGTRVENYYDRPWRDGEQRVNRLVIIAEHDFDAEAVRALFEKTQE